MPGRTLQEELRILERRKRVADLYLRNTPQFKIAELEGVNRHTIRRDLEAIRKDWHEYAAMKIDERLAQELAKIDKLETIASEAWEHSCKDAETLHVKTESNGPGHSRSVQEKTTRGQSGDERFLARIAWCIEQRAKLCGLVVQKIAPVTPDGLHPYVDLTEAEIHERLAKLAEREVELVRGPVAEAGPEESS